MKKCALLTMLLALGLYGVGCESKPPSTGSAGSGAMSGPKPSSTTPATTPAPDKGSVATDEPDIDKAGEDMPAEEASGDKPATESSDGEATPEEPTSDDKPAEESESSEQ